MASIWTRKRDLAYVLYFLIHLPVLFLIDLVPLFPLDFLPWHALSTTLRNTNINQFKDQFFIAPPPWFDFYIWMEALHVPVAFFAIWSLALREPEPHPQTPLVLLVYGLQTALTTMTCIADMLGWDDSVVNWGEKMSLLSLYGPYAAVAVYMALDCGWRIARVLGTAADRQTVRKTQ